MTLGTLKIVRKVVYHKHVRNVYAATIGVQSTSRTVLVGALLIVVGGGWIALRALRQPSIGVVDVQAQPRVKQPPGDRRA
jgi:hypothetical protein